MKLFLNKLWLFVVKPVLAICVAFMIISMAVFGSLIAIIANSIALIMSKNTEKEIGREEKEINPIG